MKRLTLSLLALALVACGGTRKGNQNNDGGNSDGGNNVNVIVNLTGTGTVQKDGATVCDGSVVSCAVPVEKGASVTLVAVPGEGFDFTSWNCGTANTSPSQMIATTTGVTCALTFTKKKVGYTAVVTPTSGGTIIGTPGNVTCGVGGSMCAATGIDYGTSVNLNLVKAQGYAFIGWTGATECAGVNTSLTFPLKSDITCNATLMKGAISISGSMSGAPGTISYAQGSGTVHSTCTSSGCGADPDGSGASTQATLTAPFVDGYYFTGWTGAGCTGGANYSTEVKGATTDVVCVANYVALTSTFNGLWANPAGACKSPETKLTFSLPAGAQAFCRPRSDGWRGGEGQRRTSTR